MRTLLSLIIVTLLSIPYTARATEPDKKKHFWASGALASLGYVAARSAGHGKLPSYAMAVGFSLAVGLTKEAFDAMDGNPLTEFDRRDIEYNAMGAFSVPLILVLF